MPLSKTCIPAMENSYMNNPKDTRLNNMLKPAKICAVKCIPPSSKFKVATTIGFPVSVSKEFFKSFALLPSLKATERMKDRY